MNKEKLQNIAKHLILNGSFISDSGLLYGKMGICIFFYHYSSYTGKQFYNDFAGELIDEIYEDIHIDTPINLGHGLCGIVWGLNYLFHHKFIDIDDEEIFHELDKYILKKNPEKIKDVSIETGLKGMAHYVICRRKDFTKKKSVTYTKYLDNLITSLTKSDPYNTYNTNLLIENLKKIQSEKEIDYDYTLLKKLINYQYSDKEISYFEINDSGILDSGYAGMGLKLMWNE